MKHILLFSFLALPVFAFGAETPVKLRLEPAVTLRGKDARQQLLATAEITGGAERDFTRKVAYKAEPPDVVKIDASGLVSAVKDGTATITATVEGVLTSVAIKVEN